MSDHTCEAAAPSLVDRLAALPEEQRRAALIELPEILRAQALYAWELWARPDQLAPPGPWRVWLLRSGRGAGNVTDDAKLTPS